jgi:hypothetical protein
MTILKFDSILPIKKILAILDIYVYSWKQYDDKIFLEVEDIDAAIIEEYIIKHNGFKL